MKHLFFALIVVTCISFGNAQNQEGTPWINSNSAPNIGPDNEIFDLAIDSENNIWALSWSGVFKLDQHGWTIFPFTFLFWPKDFLIDSNGEIWVGDDLWIGKLSHFNGATWESYLQYHVVGFAEATDTSIWIGCRHGFYKYKNGEYFKYSDSIGYPANVTNYAIAMDSSGKIWLGGNYGLMAFNGSSFTLFDTGEGLPFTYVESLDFDGQGRLWALSGNQLGMWDGKEWRLYGPADGLLPDRDKVCNDGSGKIWVLSFDSTRVNYVQDDSLMEFILPQLQDRYIQDVKCDKDNNIWFGMLVKGVAKLSSDNNFTIFQGNKANDARVIEFDNEGTFWMVNYGGLSSLNKNGEWTFRNDMTGFFTNDFTHKFFTDSTLWFCHDQGFCTCSNHVWQNDLSCPLKKVTTIYVDKSNKIWLGTKFSGIQYKDNSGWYMPENCLVHENILSMLQDHRGNMWFGSYNWTTHRGRISKFNGTNSDIYDFENSMYFIRSILEDKNHQMWAVADVDLLKFVNNQWEVQHIESECLDLTPNCYTLHEDSRGWLWVGSARGTFCRKNDSWKYYKFPEPQGFSSIIVLDITEDSSGHMYFGTQNYGVYHMEIIDDVAVIEPFKIQAGPNPATDYIRVYLPAGDTKALVQVWDMNGKCLLTEYCNESVYNLNLAGFLPGVYLLKTEQGGKTYDYKFVKQ